MWNVSDAWEFQQTEIMHAKDRLRSLRAKIAVLEGRISMTIIDAQKMAEVKARMQIDKARHALQILRTTYIIGPTQPQRFFWLAPLMGGPLRERWRSHPRASIPEPKAIPLAFTRYAIFP
ncbi:unnamed protein product [Rhodiola kirilowii]